jgi:hypothetical protein
MKHTLPLFIFLFLTLAVNAQTSFSERLSYNIPNQSEKVDLQVFPNPAVDYISVDNEKEVKRIVIFNLVGRRVRTFNHVSAEQKHNVGDLPRGMYLVQLLGDNDKILKTQRVKKS